MYPCKNSPLNGSSLEKYLLHSPKYNPVDSLKKKINKPSNGEAILQSFWRRALVFTHVTELGAHTAVLT